MATSSMNSLSGVSSGIDTAALIDAIVGMKGGTVTRLKAKKDLNDRKSSALTAMRTSLNALSLSVATLQDKLNNRTVTSTDSTNTYVTATASGVASGSFEVSVKTIATRGRLSAKLDGAGLPLDLAVAKPDDAVGSAVFTPGGTPAKFAVQGTDGVVKVITLTEGNNTLNGLRDAINSSGAGVTASVVNTGRGAQPYQLVITAKETGKGTTQGVVSLVDITNMGTDGGGNPVAGAVGNNLGIAAGTVDSLTTPTTVGGGLTTADHGASATDADFFINGIEIVRSTNTVKDAMAGVTLTLKQGGQTGTTTLSMATDKPGATAAVQDFVTKYNQLVKDYKAASTSTKNSDGSINQAPLANDPSTRALMASLKSALTGDSSGLPSDATYKRLSSIGITTLADGSLYLNTFAFQTAVTNDLAGVQKLFAFSGDSTNASVTVKSGGPNTITGTVDFSITRDGGGVLWGTFTRNGVTSDPVQVAADGTLTGTGDYAGLNLTVTGTGTGTLTLSRGVGRAATDLMASFTGTGGGIDGIIKSINIQNTGLGKQITTAQSRLDQEKEFLRKKFARMEATLGRMKAASGSLSGM